VYLVGLREMLIVLHMPLLNLLSLVDFLDLVTSILFLYRIFGSGTLAISEQLRNDIALLVS